MLGHKLIQEFSKTDEVVATTRDGRCIVPCKSTFAYEFGSSKDVDKIENILNIAKPDVAINCIGVIKQLNAAKDPLVTIPINSLLPHYLNRACEKLGIRMVHISTDCVFNGRKGTPYKEDDSSDAEDLYGRSKFLGEVESDICFTLRTSIIGRETKTTSGLVEWFLSQKGKRVNGFDRAFYTGFTTIEMARVIKNALKLQKGGLYQASSDSISKFELLEIINRKFDLGTRIEKNEEFFCDRRLDSSRFRQLTGYVPPSWEQMITEMAEDKTPYEEWRVKNV